MHVAGGYPACSLAPLLSIPTHQPPSGHKLNSSIFDPTFRLNENLIRRAWRWLIAIRKVHVRWESDRGAAREHVCHGCDSTHTAETASMDEIRCRVLRGLAGASGGFDRSCKRQKVARSWVATATGYLQTVPRSNRSFNKGDGQLDGTVSVTSKSSRSVTVALMPARPHGPVNL